MGQGESLIIGRGDEARVKLDDPRVSRVHGTLKDVSGSWIYEDASSGGSWNGPHRVTQLRITNEVRLRLGSEGAPEIVLRPSVDSNATVAVPRSALSGAATVPSVASPPPAIPAQDARPGPTGAPVPPPFIPGSPNPPARSGRVVLAVVSVLLMLLAGIAGAAVLSRRGNDTAAIPTTVPADPDIPLTPEQQLTNAKLATVQIIVFTEDGGLSTGSGAFVADDLVLTNRHVVGSATDIEIATSTVEDQPVELRFSGRVEAEHPFLDIALIRLTGASQLSDLTLGELGSPAILPLGDSTTLRIGDSVRALGFPSISGGVSRNDMGDLALPVTTVSRGEIVTFRPWPGCTNPDAEILLVPGGFGNCSPEGDLSRGNVITDDLSGSGGSGGPVIVDGEIIAVRYAVGAADDPVVGGSVSTGGVALSMPSEYFAPWVTGIINGG